MVLVLRTSKTLLKKMRLQWSVNHPYMSVKRMPCRSVDDRSRTQYSQYDRKYFIVFYAVLRAHCNACVLVTASEF